MAVFASLIMLPISASGEGSSCSKQEISAAYIERDIDELIGVFDNTPETEVVNRAELSYLIALTALAEEDEGLAESYIKDAIGELKDHEDRTARDEALLSLLYGQRLRISPMMGIFIGGRPLSHLESAEGFSDSGMMTKYARGVFHRYTPESFGGSVEHSVDSFEQSLSDQSFDSEESCWLAFAAKLELSRAYRSINKPNDRTQMVEAIISEYPMNAWIRGDDE